MAERGRGRRLLAHLPWLIGAAPLAALIVGGCWSLVEMSRLVNVHWDEFLYLSKVHAHLDGRLAVALQSLHVHLFSWVRLVSDNEVDQILAARGAMLALGLVTAGSMFAIAYRVTRSVVASLFPIAVLLGFRDMLVHLHAFRADPLLVALWLASAALLAWRAHRPRFQFAAGAILGLAMALSVKTVFFLPTFAVALLFPEGGEPWRSLAGRLARAAAAAVATWGGLLLLHQLSLPAAGVEGSVELLGNAADKAFTAFPFFPRMVYLARYLEWEPFVFLYPALGIVAAAASWRAGGKERRLAVLAASCVLPLLSLAVYRNAWPYYYVCLIPPAAVASAPLIHALERLPRSSPLVAGLAAALLCAPLIHTQVTFLRQHAVDEVSDQRLVIDAVKEIFPEPVPYLDRCGMVGSYPMAGFFMSTWTLGNYRRAGEPVMQRILEEEQPRFLIANLETIDPGRAWKKGSRGHRLLKKDHTWLRENFVRHAGPIWVVGKRVSVKPRKTRAFTIPVEGPYTVEAPAPVRIDGETVSPGGAVFLERGPHKLRLAAEEGGSAVEVTLRYGDNLPRPELPSMRNLFRDGPHPRK
jgi:hypothetical protein